MFITGAKSFLPHYREARKLIATKVSQGRRANRAPFGRQGLILWVAVSPSMSASPLPFNMPRNRLPKKALFMLGATLGPLLIDTPSRPPALDIWC